MKPLSQTHINSIELDTPDLNVTNELTGLKDSLVFDEGVEEQYGDEILNHFGVSLDDLAGYGITDIRLSSSNGHRPMEKNKEGVLQKEQEVDFFFESGKFAVIAKFQVSEDGTIDFVDTFRLTCNLGGHSSNISYKPTNQHPFERIFKLMSWHQSTKSHNKQSSMGWGAPIERFDAGTQHLLLQDYGRFLLTGDRTGMVAESISVPSKTSRFHIISSQSTVTIDDFVFEEGELKYGK